MLNLEESLKFKTVPELKDIAREYNISGFSSLKKEELITLLVQNMKSKEFQENLRDKLTDTMLLFLDIILEEGSARKYSDIKIDYIELKSATTFYKYYNLLKSYGIIFDEEDKQGVNIIYIPQELLKTVEKLVEEKQPKLEKQKATDEAIEGKDVEEDISLYSSFKTMDGLFYSSFLPIDNLKHFLLNNELSTEGTKKQLISSVLYESDLTLNEILDQLFPKIILQDICVNLQVPKSGTKENIINRIIEKLPSQKPNLIRGGKKTIAKSVGSSVRKVKTHITPKSIIEPPKSKQINKEDLYKDPEKFVDYLMNLKPPKPKDEEYLEHFLYGVLMGKFGNKVNKQESGRRGKSRYDITLEDTVLIELKVATTKKNISDGIGQLITYLGETERYKYGILGVYDSSKGKNLKSQLRDNYANVYIVIWT